MYLSVPRVNSDSCRVSPTLRYPSIAQGYEWVEKVIMDAFPEVAAEKKGWPIFSSTQEILHGCSLASKILTVLVVV